jgi:hypothetical protein
MSQGLPTFIEFAALVISDVLGAEFLAKAAEKRRIWLGAKLLRGKLRVWMPNVAPCCTWLHFLRRSVSTSVSHSTKKPLEVIQGLEIGCRGWI